MTPEKRASLIQRIISVIKDQLTLNRPSWFIADRIVRDVVEPEVQEIKDRYEKLFYTDDSSKH